MNKEDGEFLARVAEHAPEALDAMIPKKAFDVVTKKPIQAPPHPKQRRTSQKRKNAK